MHLSGLRMISENRIALRPKSMYYFKKLKVSILVPNGLKKNLTCFFNYFIFPMMFIIGLDEQGLRLFLVFFDNILSRLIMAVDDQYHKYTCRYYFTRHSVVKDDFEELYHKFIMRWSSAIR